MATTLRPGAFYWIKEPGEDWSPARYDERPNGPQFWIIGSCGAVRTPWIQLESLDEKPPENHTLIGHEVAGQPAT